MVREKVTSPVSSHIRLPGPNGRRSGRGALLAGTGATAAVMVDLL